MYSILHIKVFCWFVVFCALSWFAYLRRNNIDLKVNELILRLKRRVGGQISLNESFADDLERGLNSHNFDILSENSNDTRAGLDDHSKQEIVQIMETENISFDKARLLYMERKFGQNQIAPDGTPMDPKAFTFSV